MYHRESEKRAPLVLLIDDEPNLLLGLREVMKHAGFEVLTAWDGAEGIKLAREKKPDLIVCDVMMPPPDGMEVRTILARNPVTERIPFIFLTARTNQEDKLQGLRLGADDYITKPFDVDEMIARIRGILRRQDVGWMEGARQVEASMEHLRREITRNFQNELRNPLAAVLGCLQLVVDERFSDDLAERQWFIATALSSAQELRSLVEDVLLLNDLDHAAFCTVRQPIELGEDIRRLLENRSAFAQYPDLNSHVSITTSIPRQTLFAPREELYRAILHLVDNACKFSPLGGRVDFDLEVGEDGECTLTIADAGQGIPQELREEVFERYYQGDPNDARSYGGLGVGLTIARAVARALSGDVLFLDCPLGCVVRMTFKLDTRSKEQLDGER